MGLWVPPTRFGLDATIGQMQHNLPATPATAMATTITCGTANVKGAYSAGQLIATTNFEVFFMSIVAMNTGASATLTGTLLDIGVGASGSETTIINNLLVGWRSPFTTGSGGVGNFNFPIRIPKGVRIAARAQSQVASKAFQVAVWLWGAPTQPPWWTCVGVDSYGPDTATSRGVSITPNATAGVEGTWTSVGGTTSKPYKAIWFEAQGNIADTTMLNTAYHWEVGDGTNTWGEWYGCGNTNEIWPGAYPKWPVYLDVPTGTQMQVRSESSAATGEAIDVGLYGLY